MDGRRDDPALRDDEGAGTVIRATVILVTGLLVVIVLALAGCAVALPHPPLVCVPVLTSTGQAVLYCEPHVPSEAR